MKIKKIIALAIALTMALAVLAGCQAKNDGEVKIGIAAPDVTHGWVAGVAYYAEKYCKENNITYKITTSTDAAEMTSNLNDLVTWGADAIVTWPQWSGMEDSVADIIAQGVPVVSFDFDIDTDGIYKVTGNNYDMGYQSAKYIVDKVGEKAVIGVFSVPSAGSVSELRVKGFYDYLDEIGYDRSNMFEISESAFGRDAGLSDMTDALTSHDKIDAIFSIDDENSIGILQACVEAGRTDVRAITGGGGMQEYFRMIKDEKNDGFGLASALYSPSMVENAIKAAIDLCEGKECEKEIVIPTTVVTKENVDEYIDDNNKVY
ncbi:MAG: substrate-binding domain-containing protein [Clostridia bacterium]|nr:substrate-binding domain-containing protein [Clostridia bacterium]